MSVEIGDSFSLRGIIDRVDTAPDGAVRIVDYKTGRAPSAAFEGKAMFQMRFYALVIWKSMGTLPRLLQLLYLGSGHVIRYEPDEGDLLATERKIRALWAAISSAQESGHWPANPSKLCDWCDYKRFCPEFGGTPPPLPNLDAWIDADDAPEG